jgi:PAS domain S-box-containing protein
LKLLTYFSSRKLSTRVILLVMVLTTVVSLVISTIISRYQHAVAIEEYSAQMHSISNENEKTLQSKIKDLSEDDLYISELPVISEFIRAIEHSEAHATSSTLTACKNRLQSSLGSFMKGHPEYYKIRLIRTTEGGKELVGVRWLNGLLQALPEKVLTQKAEQEFFREGLRLQKSQIYLTNFFHRQHRETGETSINSIQAATPVYNSAGEMFGLVVVSLNADLVLQPLTSGYANEVTTFVASSTGEFLLHPNASLTFGGSGEQKYNLKDEFPELAQLQNSKTELFLSAQYVSSLAKSAHVYFTKYAFDPALPSRYLTVIHAIPDSEIAAKTADTINSANKIIWALAISIVGLLQLLIPRLFLPLNNLSKVAEQITKGNWDITLPHSSDKEINSLIESFGSMIREVKLRESLLEKRVAERTAELNLEKMRLQLLADNVAGFATYLLDTQGNISSWNEGAVKLTGYAKEEVLGSPIDRFLTPEDIEANKPKLIIERAKKTGIYLDEGWRVRKDGSRFFADVVISSLKNEDGTLLGYVEIMRDISERHRYEERLQTIVQSAPIPLLMVTAKGYISLVNFQLEKLFGYSAGELLGKPIEVLLPGRFREAHVHSRDQYLLRPKSRPMGEGQELIGLGKDGVEFPVEVGLGAIQIAGEHLILATIHDISDRKMTEALLINARDKSEAANRSKSDFLANMSHEIRTPMNAIIGFTQLTLDTNLSPRQRDHLRKVHTSSKALLKILDDILDYSKIEAGKLDIETVDFSLDDVLKQISELFSAIISEKRLELFLEVDHDLQFNLLGDPLRLGQILSNLVGNAIKFTEQGEIHVKIEILRRDGHEVELLFTVRDTGIGMSEAQSNLLFNAFIQADSSITRKYGGSGLGLSISKRLVELMGGKIALSSALDKGTTFTFTTCFGLGRTHQDRPNQVKFENMRALVLDDRQTSLDMLNHYLAAWKFDITATTSGEEAFTIFELANGENHPYEIVFVDWEMPNLNGVEFIQRLETRVKNSTHPSVKIILMVAAYDKERLLRDASEIHFDYILDKPVTLTSLQNCLLQIQQPQLATQVALEERRVDLYKLASPIMGARILVAEDNEFNQEVVQEILNKAGLAVTIANHGGEAVEWVKNEIFDAVLMDLQMPVMDGLMATKLIRNLPLGKDLPIIALSASTMVHEIQATEQAGMNSHLSKPIDQEQLITCLLKWIKQGRNTNAAPIFGNTTVISSSSLPDKLPGFDLLGALTRLGGNKVLLSKLLLRFATEYAFTFSQLEELLNENQTAKAASLLHRIKGASATLGATALAEAAMHLEIEVVTGQPLESKNAFAKSLTDSVNIIKNNIHPLGHQENVARRLPNVPLIETCLFSLASCLKNQEMLEDDKIEACLSNLSGLVSARLLADFEQHLNNFDFEAGSATLVLIEAEWKKRPL